MNSSLPLHNASVAEGIVRQRLPGPSVVLLSLGSRKVGSPMPSTAILQEVQRLYGVSDRLDSMSELHPLISEALLVISGSVRNTATLLEVLVATKMLPLTGVDPAN